MLMETLLVYRMNTHPISGSTLLRVAIRRRVLLITQQLVWLM